MTRIFSLMFTFYLCTGYTVMQAQAFWSGIFTFTKGVNKPFGIVHIIPVKQDTVFFMSNAVSGDPDFLSTELKGFIQVDSVQGIYQGKASCRLRFTVNKSSLLIDGDTMCTFDYTPCGKYRRVDPKINKSAALLFNFTELKGSIKKEGCEGLAAPHPEARIIRTFTAETEIRILDQFNQYFLIEKKETSKEYLWVLKKNVTLRK